MENHKDTAGGTRGVIERNRHPAGRSWNALFGFAEIIDGLVRVLSLGFLHTRLLLVVTKHQARRMITKLKKRRAALAASTGQEGDT